jgi:hypothetical protein
MNATMRDSTMNKPRSLFRARAHAPAASLNTAMLEVVAEDLIASPCTVCGRPGDFIASWMPTADVIARELDGDSSRARALFYRLCRGCAGRVESDRQFITTVEASILQLWRAGNVHRVTDGAGAC